MGTVYSYIFPDALDMSRSNNDSTRPGVHIAGRVGTHQTAERSRHAYAATAGQPQKPSSGNDPSHWPKLQQPSSAPPTVRGTGAAAGSAQLPVVASAAGASHPGKRCDAQRSQPLQPLQQQHPPYQRETTQSAPIPAGPQSPAAEYNASRGNVIAEQCHLLSAAAPLACSPGQPADVPDHRQGSSSTVDTSQGHVGARQRELHLARVPAGSLGAGTRATGAYESGYSPQEFSKALRELHSAASKCAKLYSDTVLQKGLSPFTSTQDAGKVLNPLKEEYCLHVLQVQHHIMQWLVNTMLPHMTKQPYAGAPQLWCPDVHNLCSPTSSPATRQKVHELQQELYKDKHQVLASSLKADELPKSESVKYCAACLLQNLDVEFAVRSDGSHQPPALHAAALVASFALLLEYLVRASSSSHTLRLSRLPGVATALPDYDEVIMHGSKEVQAAPDAQVTTDKVLFCLLPGIWEGDSTVLVQEDVVLLCSAS